MFWWGFPNHLAINVNDLKFSCYISISIFFFPVFPLKVRKIWFLFDANSELVASTLLSGIAKELNRTSLAKEKMEWNQRNKYDELLARDPEWNVSIIQYSFAERLFHIHLVHTLCSFAFCTECDECVCMLFDRKLYNRDFTFAWT